MMHKTRRFVHFVARDVNQLFRQRYFSSTYGRYTPPTALRKELAAIEFAKRSPIVLRDSCSCPKCVDPSTKQREFSFADIPIDIGIKEIKISKGSVQIEWENDIPGYTDHVSSFNENDMKDDPLPPTEHLTLWDQQVFEKETKRISYSDLMESDHGLAKTLRLIERHGLMFVQDVPKDEEAVKRLANRIGKLRNTFYGETWNVQSVPQAKNVAYTSKFLDYHMDLLYMREPPGLQLLHTLENSCQGGESLFADTFKAIDQLDQTSIAALKQGIIRYTYDNDGHYYTDKKAVVTFGRRRQQIKNSQSRHANDIHRVYWSPPFIGKIEVPESNFVEFIKASKKFESILDKNTYQTRTEPGTCAIFNNLRVVHARKSFDINSGKRWLKGAYADYQDFYSQRYQLKDVIRQLGPDHPSKTLNSKRD